MLEGSPDNKPVIAAFDFDGTLTRRNTFVPFLYALSRSKIGFAGQWGGLIPFLPLLLSGESGRNQFKKQVIRQFFRGISQERLQAQAERFFSQTESELFLPEGLKRLEWHLKEQHRCYLVSANVTPFLDVWVMRYPGLQLIATDLECCEGVYTGEMISQNCWGEEKMRRLRVALAPEKEWTLYSYGDSQGDRALLEQADYAHYRPFR